MAKRVFRYLLAVCAIATLAILILPHQSGRRPPKILMTRVDIYNLGAALNQFKINYGVYPSGTKAELLKTLRGDNPKKILLINLNSKSINSRGEFMDPWESPYEITIYGQTRFTIRSAGPNRVFGDKDDIEFSSDTKAQP